MNEIQVSDHLQPILSPKLYVHCLGVVEVAGALAQAQRVDVEKTRLAAWLHDYAREWQAADLLQFAQDHGIPIDEYAWRQPVLLHGAVAAEFARQLGINDFEILTAIKNHTLGNPGMSRISQIVYLADKIEPNRSYPGVDDLRYYVHHDFSKALRMATANSITYVLEKEQMVHPQAIAYWNYLVQNKAEGV